MKEDIYKTLVTQTSGNRLIIQKVRNFSKYPSNIIFFLFNILLLLLGGNLELCKYLPQVSRFIKKNNFSPQPFILKNIPAE